MSDNTTAEIVEGLALKIMKPRYNPMLVLDEMIKFIEGYVFSTSRYDVPEVIVDLAAFQSSNRPDINTLLVDIYRTQWAVVEIIDKEGEKSVYKIRLSAI